MARRAGCRQPWRPIVVASPQGPSASWCRENPPKLTFTGSLSRPNPAPDENPSSALAPITDLTATAPGGDPQVPFCRRHARAARPGRADTIKPVRSIQGSKRSQAGARKRLFTERRPGIVHGRAEDALRHEIGLSGKALMIDVAFEGLRLAIVGRGARDPF